MNISRKNSFAPRHPLGFTVVPYQPVNIKDATPAACEAAGGDMIELSYSHGKPSTAADVMTPIRRAFELAEQPGDGKHTVTASGRVDDSVSVKVDGTKKESSSGSAHNFSLTFENLSPGLHCINVKHNNINYYPEPTGNISLINGTVGSCPAVTIIPGENDKDECECPCAIYDDNGGGGSSSSSRSSSRTGLPLRLASPSSGDSSSAGSGVVRSATLQYMRWAASFGAFRGMGGIPGGRLELTGYDGYNASLLTPVALAYRHPAASAVLVPEGGIVPNAMFRVYEGGGYFNYVCDADGMEAFGVGATSSDTKRIQFVTALSREESRVTTLDAACYLRVAKTDGSVSFYNLITGAFEGYISRSNSLLTAQQAESCLAVLRQEDGILRQLWNLWDGLADIVPEAAGAGYTVSLYLPGQVTGIDETSGLYTATGDPFKSFTIGGGAADQTLTVIERDWALPVSVEPLVATWGYANGQWSLELGEGNEAVTTTKERIALKEEDSYRILTTVSKGEVTASITAEDYLSHPVGELLLARMEGYGMPEAQTTDYEYDDTGRLIAVTAPDGGKTTYLHDDANRVVITTTPWVGGKSRLVQTTYLDDGSEYSNEPQQVEENVVLASGSVKLLRRDVYTYSIANHVKRVEKRSTVGDVTRLETTETWQGSAENAHARGRTRMNQGVDGVQTWYDYAVTTDHGALYSVTAETRVEGAAVPGQSTRNVSYITAEGNTVREERHILDSAGTWRLLAAADYEFDEQNRWIKRTRSNGRITTRTYMCSGDLLSETDENGLTTTYGYDSARQLVEVIRSAVTDGERVITPETIVSYTRDAQGRVLQTRTDKGAMTTVESTEYDLLGRVTSLTDALGRTTTYAYSADGLTTTLTTPSRATLVTRRHSDGSVLEESGTSQRATNHIYDLNGNTPRHTVRLGAPGDNGAILSQDIQDGFGQVITHTSPTTLTDNYLYDRSSYDARGLLVRQQRDTGSGFSALRMVPTLYEYDAFGNVTKETLLLDAESPEDPARNPITAYAYAVEKRDDGVYRITTTTKNNSAGTTYTENTAVLLSESVVIEQKSVATDLRGNVATVWTEYGTGSQRTQKSSIPTSDITATVTVMDGFTTAQTDHAGVTTTQTRAFTATGMTLTRIDARGNATTTKTDIAGRTVSVADAAGNTTTTSYSPCCDNPATVTDALGNAAHYKYDARGRKTAEWGTAIQPVLFAYDASDRMICLTTFRADAGDIVTDPTGRTDGDFTAWQYHDATGLLLKKTYADSTHEDTAYNALNLKATLTDSRGIVTTCTYETARGLLTGETYSDATLGRSYAYNHLGLMTQIVDASGTRTIAYTTYNEPESESLSGDGKTHLITELRDDYGRNTGYRYAKAGSVQQTTSIGYGTDGRMTTAGFLHGGLSKSFSFGYLENSHLLQSLSMPNNMTLTRVYEEKRDLVTAMAYRRTTTTVVNRGYTYDALARPVTRTTARQGTTRNDSFTYNGRSELGTATLGTAGYGYGYDNIGNRKTAQELADALTYASNSLNQYMSITKGAEAPFVPTYDANGNQTLVKTATDLWTVQYDANNRPVSFTKTEGENTTVVECGYDYMGRRYMKKVTTNGTVTLHHRYIYRGYLQVACCDLTRSTHPCLWLITWDPAEPEATRPLVIQKDGTWYCYGHDITKNVWELFGSSGYMRTAYDYTPYGGVVEEGDVAQPVQWSSEMYDAELAMVYYNYRYYNPMDGGWINRDPIAEDGGWNLYAFVGNDGVNRWDYLGEFYEGTWYTAFKYFYSSTPVDKSLWIGGKFTIAGILTKTAMDHADGATSGNWTLNAAEAKIAKKEFESSSKHDTSGKSFKDWFEDYLKVNYCSKPDGMYKMKTYAYNFKSNKGTDIYTAFGDARLTFDGEVCKMKKSGKCIVEYFIKVNLSDYYTFISASNRILATTFRGQKSPTAVGYRLEDSGYLRPFHVNGTWEMRGRKES